MPGTVDECDTRVVPSHACGACLDGDLALTFDRVRVEKLRTGGELSGWDSISELEQTVAESAFAGIDVRDNDEVAETSYRNGGRVRKRG